MSKEAPTLSFHGAGILAREIETYWHALGHTSVRAERYEIPDFPGQWGVRSNLVNGLPPRT